MTKREEITNWLLSERDYNEGLALYQKHSKNKRMYANMIGKERRMARKLSWELAKLAGYSQDEWKKGKFDKQKQTPDSKKRQQTKDNDAPLIIIKIRHTMSELYNERAQLFKKQQEIAGNTEKAKGQRAELIEKIEALSQKLDQLYIHIEKYEKEKKVPKNEEVFVEKKNGMEEQSVSDLWKRRRNLIASLTKDRNKRDYQQTTKGRRKNQMPDGPKREKLLERIAQKNQEIKLIEKELDRREK